MALGDRAEGMQVDGMTMVLKGEYEKGVRAGMLLVADLPRAVVEYQDERIKQLTAIVEAEKAEKNEEMTDE